MHPLIKAVESDFIRSDRPDLDSGDTVRVHTKVVEGNKERIQIFEGYVIRRRGTGVAKSFTVRRIAHGVGVERTFLLNSPRIDKIEIVKRAIVHRKNLYYMRKLQGKSAKLRERRI